MAWIEILKDGQAADKLLGPDDPAPFALFNAAGRSPFLLIGDHAGSAIPTVLGDLGVQSRDLERHIALDIGVLGMGHALANLLDAPFLHQTYSRLVIDCNRDPRQPDAMPDLIDGSRIAGNEGLGARERTARTASIHTPYHAAICAVIDARQAMGRQPILLSLHSFTPVMAGIVRPWDIGILYSKAPTDFARALLNSLTKEVDIIVGDNVPYAMDDTDYTVPRHAFPRALAYAEIEVRQDLIATPQGQRDWAVRLAETCRKAAGI